VKSEQVAFTRSAVYMSNDRRLLEFLEECGMRPGSKLKLEGRNYDRTVSLITERGSFSVGEPVAQRVWVTLADTKRGQSQ